MRKLALGLVLVVIATMPLGAWTSPATAKATVPNSTAADMLTRCLLAKDHDLSGTTSTRTECCSDLLGFCIDCSMDPGEKCVKTSIREYHGRSRKSEAPGGGYIAPENVKPGRVPHAPRSGMAR